MAKITKKEQLKKVKDHVGFIHKLIDQKAEGAEGILVTFHVVKDGRINHNYSYQHFPLGDWGMCMVSMGAEARSALLNAQSGAAKPQ